VNKRFDNRIVFRNTSATYQEHFVDRNVNHISQFNTAEFRNLEPEDLGNIHVRRHIWKTGDKLFKLSHQSYGSTRLWWIISWFNQKPLESDFKIGEVIDIPFPLSDVLTLFYSRNS
jgi:hypothetical protein